MPAVVVSWLSYAKQEESFSRDNLIRSLSSLSALRQIRVRYILGTFVTLSDECLREEQRRRLTMICCVLLRVVACVQFEFEV